MFLPFESMGAIVGVARGHRSDVGHNVEYSGNRARTTAQLRPTTMAIRHFTSPFVSVARTL